MKSLLLAVMITLSLAAFPSAFAAGQESGGRVQDRLPAAVISGFRSAQFGDGESELLPKIAKDLGIDVKAIKADTHPVERTRLLVAEANNLIPDSGTASVAYILGANTKTLMQVNVVWTASTDRASLERIGNTANILRDHLQGKGSYAKDSVAVNARLPDDSVLVFRGTDAGGHMVVLHLVPPPPKAVADGKNGGEAPEVRAVLRLSYIEKPNAPDVLKLAPSAF